MSFNEDLAKGSFCFDLQGTTSEDVIRSLVDRMADDGHIADREAVCRAVLAREKLLPTGLQSGVAVPHGKVEGMEGFAVAFGLHRKGVDFGAQDGKACRIFFMTVSSTRRSGPHVRYLAEISRLLMQPSVRRRLLHARTREDVVAALCDVPGSETTASADESGG